MQLRTAVVIGLIAGWGTSALADITREGSGPRREALDKMELSAFDPGLWGKLSAWSGGEALTAANTGGSVVLICTWSSWYPPSIKQGLPVAQKLADKFGSQGLIVVGVHHAQGWDQAAAAAAGAGAKFLMAHDASGEFRKGLQVDQDPDFYVLDRAGRLRYADVASASVEEAVSELVAETKERASDLPRLLAEREAAARSKAAANVPIRADVELGSLPAVPPGYDQPEDARYEALTDALWSKEARQSQAARDAGLVDQNGQPLTSALNIAPDAFPEGFDTNAVAGRVIVVYLWHPDVRESYSQFERMDRLQRQSPRDLVVIGACTPRQNLEGANSQFNSSGQQPAETAEELERKFDAFKRARKFDHLIVFDPGATAALSWPQNVSMGGATQVPLPRVAIASSDGTIRYTGSAQTSVFQSWLDRVVQYDPGVQLRRRLDEKYLRERKK